MKVGVVSGSCPEHPVGTALVNPSRDHPDLYPLARFHSQYIAY